jgi:hypothetical protein
VTIIQGNKLKKIKITDPDVNNAHENPIKIFSNA